MFICYEVAMPIGPKLVCLGGQTDAIALVSYALVFGATIEEITLIFLQE
jgi:hypothetical protein